MYVVLWLVGLVVAVVVLKGPAEQQTAVLGILLKTKYVEITGKPHLVA